MKEEEFKALSKEIFTAIEESNNILLHLHPSPDPDSMGSALATAEVCRELGKKTTVIKGDTDLPQGLSGLPGFETIIKKEYGEVDLEEFDLFIILDSGGKEMISRKVDVEFPQHLKTVVIDHHATNPHYGDINLVDSSKPATAQILTKLFLDWQVGVTESMAINLFLGIYEDTGGFKYRGVTKETFDLAGYLFEIAPIAIDVVMEIERQMSKKSLLYKSLTFASIEDVAGGRAAVAGLSYEEFNEAGLSIADVEGLSLANEILGVKDFVMTATVMEKEAGKCRVSMRSKDPEIADVSKIAEALGGGGHKMAAGALLLLSLSEAKEKVIKEIERIIR